MWNALEVDASGCEDWVRGCIPVLVISYWRRCGVQHLGSEDS